jgi:hypothetical protein
MYLDDVRIVIDGHYQNTKALWEMQRMNWYYTAAFGNCDAKRLPKKLNKFHPFPWDEIEPKLSAKEMFERHAKTKALIEKRMKDGRNAQIKDNR